MVTIQCQSLQTIQKTGRRAFLRTALGILSGIEYIHQKQMANELAKALS